MQIEIFGIKNVRKVIHVTENPLDSENLKQFLVLDNFGRLHKVKMNLLTRKVEVLRNYL